MEENSGFSESALSGRLKMVKINLQLKYSFDPIKAEAMTREKLQKALLALMLSIEKNAKRHAPVDTGLLRASIHTEPTRPADKITVGDGVSYGVFQEFGTTKMRPHPFLRPAAEIAFAVDFPLILNRLNLKVKKKASSMIAPAILTKYGLKTSIPKGKILPSGIGKKARVKKARFSLQGALRGKK